MNFFGSLLDGHQTFVGDYTFSSTPHIPSRYAPVFEPTYDLSRKAEDLRALSAAYPLWVGDDDSFVIVSDLKLPPGFGQSRTNALIELPPDYPISPPGVGDSHVYLDPALRFRHRVLKDLHDNIKPDLDTPGFGLWAWWCYEHISWDPKRDDLIRFVEMLRSDLTNPQTKGRFF